MAQLVDQMRVVRFENSSLLDPALLTTPALVDLEAQEQCMTSRSFCAYASSSSTTRNSVIIRR
jgi:hypothetical protein